VDRLLKRYALITYSCHLCSGQYSSPLYFADHLVTRHGLRDLALLGFTGRDWRAIEMERGQQSLMPAEAPSASSQREFEPFPVEMPRA